MIFGAIGCGNMGSAIINALGQLPKTKVIGYDPNESNLQVLAKSCALEICQNELEVAKKAEIILIGVKPYGVEKVLEQISQVLNPNKIIVSMAAGISLEKMRIASRGVCPVVSIMPNTPAMVGAGCCALCFDDPKLSEEQKKLLQEYFSKISITTILTEEQMPQFSALLGSGPAFVFYFQEAMQEAAIRLGFSQADSKQLIDQLFAGCAKLSQSQPEANYAKLRLNVCSPKGSSIVGVNTLDQKAVKSGIIECILATCDRANEMSK